MTQEIKTIKELLVSSLITKDNKDYYLFSRKELEQLMKTIKDYKETKKATEIFKGQVLNSRMNDYDIETGKFKKRDYKKV